MWEGTKRKTSWMCSRCGDRKSNSTNIHVKKILVYKYILLSFWLYWVSLLCPSPSCFIFLHWVFLHFVVKKVKEHFFYAGCWHSLGKTLLLFAQNVCLFVSGACLTVFLAFQSRNFLQLLDCTRTVWKVETLQHIFPKSLNRCFIFAEPRHAIYYANIWQWFNFFFLSNLLHNQVIWGALPSVQLHPTKSNWLSLGFFFFFKLFLFFSSLLKAKYQICTQGGGVDCIRLVLRLNFDFHQSKDVCFVVVVVCRKAASLFRGTFCYMMLTDIPLCIWLFALCFTLI